MAVENDIEEDLAAYDVAVMDFARATADADRARAAYDSALAAARDAERKRDEIRTRIVAHGSTKRAPSPAARRGNGHAPAPRVVDPEDEEPKPAPTPRVPRPPVPAPRTSQAVRMPPADERAATSMGVWTVEAVLNLWSALSPEWKPRFHRLMGGAAPVAELIPGQMAGPQFAGLMRTSRTATRVMSPPIITEDGIARLSDGLGNALRAAGVHPKGQS